MNGFATGRYVYIPKHEERSDDSDSLSKDFFTLNSRMLREDGKFSLGIIRLSTKGDQVSL